MKATNNKNVKYLILIPVFVLFFITVKAISKKSTKKILTKTVQRNDNNTKIVIDKNTSDKDFSAIMTSLKEKGIIAAFKSITRNENNEIIAIDIEVTRDGSASSYSAKSNIAINKIIIEIKGNQVSIHNDGLFSFGFSNTDEVSKLMQQNGISNQFNDERMQKIMQQQQQFFNNFNFPDVEDDGNNIDKDDFDFSKKIKSTYIVNGKEMTKEAYEKMDKSEIKTLEIKKEVIKSYYKVNKF